MATQMDVNQLQCAADLFEFDEEKRLTFKEFFGKYKDQFPMLAVVIGGLYGDTHFDTFDHLQVMRIHCYSSQPRVLCVDDKEASSVKYHYLTIPLNIGVNFRVVRSHKRVGGAQSLREILEENKLPVLVKMACGDEYPVKRGLSSCRAGNFGNLLITEQYLEHYFMLNCIDTVNLKMNPIVCLGALSDELEATPVEGFKYDTKENYEKFLQKLADQVANSGEKYDRTRGDPAIEEYCSEDVDVETGRGGIPTYNAPKIDLSTIYPDMKKKKPDAPQRRPSEKDGSSDSDDDYEHIEDKPPIPKRIPKSDQHAEMQTPDTKSKKQPKPGKNIIKALPKTISKGRKMLNTVISRVKSKDDTDEPEDELDIGHPVFIQNFKHRHPHAKTLDRTKIALPAGCQPLADDQKDTFTEDDQEIYDTASEIIMDAYASSVPEIDQNTVKERGESDSDDEYTYIDENQISCMKRIDSINREQKHKTESKRKIEFNTTNRSDYIAPVHDGKKTPISNTDISLIEEDDEYEYIDESTLKIEAKPAKKRTKPNINAPKPQLTRQINITRNESDREKTAPQWRPGHTQTSQPVEPPRDAQGADYGEVLPPDKVVSQPKEEKLYDKSEMKTTASFVENMTIKEVGEALCKLRLGKYVDKFASEQIDGKVLALLEPDDLVNELKMLKLEAIRLTAFKRDGHIPS